MLGWGRIKPSPNNGVVRALANSDVVASASLPLGETLADAVPGVLVVLPWHPGLSDAPHFVQVFVSGLEWRAPTVSPTHKKAHPACEGSGVAPHTTQDMVRNSYPLLWVARGHECCTCAPGR